MWKQRVTLKDEARIAFPRRQCGDVPFAKGHDTAGWLDKARDDAERRGLAAARWSKQHEKLAIRHIKRHVVNGAEIAITLGDVSQLQPCHAHTTRLILT
jgi:hypothetical protein